MHRILSRLDARETYLLLMIVDFGTAVVSAKLIVHATKLIAGVVSLF
jgi:hypothetical protein